MANTLAYLSPSIRDKKGFTRMILGVIGMKLFFFVTDTSWNICPWQAFSKQSNISKKYQSGLLNVTNTLAYLSPSIRDKKGFTRMILGVIGMKLFFFVTHTSWNVCPCQPFSEQSNISKKYQRGVPNVANTLAYSFRASETKKIVQE